MTERELAEELTAHTFQAHELAKQLLQYSTQRDESRQRMARLRANAPTKHAQSDPASFERRRA